MRSALLRTFLVGGALTLASSAGILTADFNESLDLPGYSSSGPRLLQNLGVSLPGTPPQLTAADTIANPSGWGNVLNVSFDPATNILSLTGDGGNDYQIITVTLSNLVFSGGEQIIGITPISTGNAVYDYGSYQFTINQSFSADSFWVTYSVLDLNSNQLFNIQPQTDTFQITLGSAAVPEPGTLGLTALALLAVGWKFRRTAR